MDFAVPAEHKVKIKENTNSDIYLDLAREQNIYVEHKSDGDTNCKWCARKIPQRPRKGTGGFRKQRISRDHQDYKIIMTDKNSEERPGIFKRLAVYQIPVKNNQNYCEKHAMI